MRVREKKKAGGIAFDIANYLFMALFSFSIIYPFWNMLLISLASQTEVTSLGFRIWNKVWTTGAYGYLFSTSRIAVAYANTIYRTAMATALTIAVTIFAAYALSKRNLPWRNWITIFFLVPMFFGGGLIPSYLLIRTLGLMDTRWALILPGLAGSFNIIIMRNFLMAIDKELEEAAFIDGAGYATVLLRVVAPLSMPVVATVSLWTAVGHWNAWFDAMVYIRDEAKMVLQLLLRNMITMNQSDAQDMLLKLITQRVKIHSASVIAAATIVTIGPIVLAYPFFQKYFVKGILIGSLKG
jgi:putative aldouronate transport system permease protein